MQRHRRILDDVAQHMVDTLLYKHQLRQMDNTLCYDDDELENVERSAFDRGQGDNTETPPKDAQVDAAGSNETSTNDSRKRSKKNVDGSGKNSTSRASSRTNPKALHNARPPQHIRFPKVPPDVLAALVNDALYPYFTNYAQHLGAEGRADLVYGIFGERYSAWAGWNAAKEAKEEHGAFNTDGSRAGHPLDGEDGLRDYLMTALCDILNCIIKAGRPSRNEIAHDSDLANGILTPRDWMIKGGGKPQPFRHPSIPGFAPAAGNSSGADTNGSGRTDIFFVVDHVIRIALEIKPEQVLPNMDMQQIVSALGDGSLVIGPSGVAEWKAPAGTVTDGVKNKGKALLEQIWMQFRAVPTVKFLILTNGSRFALFRRSDKWQFETLTDTLLSIDTFTEGYLSSLLCTMLGLSVLSEKEYATPWAGQASGIQHPEDIPANDQPVDNAGNQAAPTPRLTRSSARNAAPSPGRRPGRGRQAGMQDQGAADGGWTEGEMMLDIEGVTGSDSTHRFGDSTLKHPREESTSLAPMPHPSARDGVKKQKAPLTPEKNVEHLRNTSTHTNTSPEQLGLLVEQGSDYSTDGSDWERRKSDASSDAESFIKVRALSSKDDSPFMATIPVPLGDAFGVENSHATLDMMQPTGNGNITCTRYYMLPPNLEIDTLPCVSIAGAIANAWMERPARLGLPHLRVAVNSADSRWHGAMWSVFQARLVNLQAAPASSDLGDAAYPFPQSSEKPFIVKSTRLLQYPAVAEYDDDFDREAVKNGILTEYKAYNGPLAALQGSVVPRCYGLFVSDAVECSKVFASDDALSDCSSDDGGTRDSNRSSHAWETEEDHMWVMLMEDGGREMTEEHLSLLPFHAKVQILKAFRDLHQAGVLHNDVAARNILFGAFHDIWQPGTSGIDVKIIDFGNAHFAIDYTDEEWASDCAREMDNVSRLIGFAA